MVNRMFIAIMQKSNLWIIFIVVIISFSLPGLLKILNFDIAKITDIESISIISGFISSALAILITNTSLPKNKEKNVRDNEEYQHLLRVKKTPQRIYQDQKEFLLWSILFQIILVLITILIKCLSDGITNIGYIKSTFDYLGLAFFFVTGLSILIITYHTIKHVSDFDIGIK